MRLGIILKAISLMLVIVAVVLLFPTIFSVNFTGKNGWFIIGVLGIASALLYLVGSTRKDRTPSVKAFQHTLGGFFKILGIVVFVVAVIFYFTNRISTPELADYYTINVGTLSILVVSTVLIIIGYFISRDNK
jgi:hypothetical protein